jgi:hypothetical protein
VREFLQSGCHRADLHILRAACRCDTIHRMLKLDDLDRRSIAERPRTSRLAAAVLLPRRSAPRATVQDQVDGLRTSGPPLRSTLPADREFAGTNVPSFTLADLVPRDVDREGPGASLAALLEGVEARDCAARSSIVVRSRLRNRKNSSERVHRARSTRCGGHAAVGSQPACTEHRTTRTLGRARVEGLSP